MKLIILSFFLTLSSSAMADDGAGGLDDLFGDIYQAISGDDAPVDDRSEPPGYIIDGGPVSPNPSTVENCSSRVVKETVQTYDGCSIYTNSDTQNLSSDDMSKLDCSTYCDGSAQNPDNYCYALPKYKYSEQYKGCEVTINGNGKLHDPEGITEQGCPTVCHK